MTIFTEDFAEHLGERILAKMAEGLSLAAAAAECDVHRQRIYEWEKLNEEFAKRIDLGRGKRQAFLERRMLDAKDGPIVTSSIFALKNANPEDWADRKEVAHSGEMTVVSKEQRDAAVAAASRANE